MRIYNIIFIVYLELITNLIKNSYRRRKLSIFIIIVEDEKKYKIKKLLKKRTINRNRE